MRAAGVAQPSPSRPQGSCPWVSSSVGPRQSRDRSPTHMGLCVCVRVCDMGMCGCVCAEAHGSTC